MRISLIAFNARYIHSCPALFYVRNALHEKLPECDIDLHQFTINDPYYDTLLRITSSKASALFFSVYIWNVNYINRLIKDLAEIVPNIPTLFWEAPRSHATRQLHSLRNAQLLEEKLRGWMGRFIMI